ncbi:MAG: ATP-binding protein [bacterium]
MNNRFGSFTNFFLLLLIFVIVIPVVLIQLVIHNITVQNLQKSIDQRLSEYVEAFIHSFSNECRSCRENLYFAKRVLFNKSHFNKEEIGSFFFDRECRFYRVNLLDSLGRSLFSFVSNPDQTFLSPKSCEEFRELPPIDLTFINKENDTLPISWELIPIPGGYAQRTIFVLNNNNLLLTDISLYKIFTNSIKNSNLSSGSFISIFDSSDALLLNSAIDLSSDELRRIKRENLNGDYKIKNKTYRVKNFTLDTIPEIFKSIKTLGLIVGIDYTGMLEGIDTGLGKGLSLTTIFAISVCLVFIITGLYLKNKTSIILKRTDEIARGDFEKEISVRFPNEFRFIAQNINQLGSRLKSLTQERVKSAKLSAIGKFAAHMVHDLRNPVYGISLLAYELKDAFPKDSSHRKYLNEILNGIKRLGEIIDRIAEHGRIYESKLEVVEIDKLISEVIQEFKRTYPCEIIFKPGNAGILKIDPAQWRRVFLNLFHNSYEAKKERCLITIRTYKEIAEGTFSPDTSPSRPSKKSVVAPFMVHIEISDKSGGIPEHILTDIYEPFVTTKKKGLGLGLSFVKEIVEVHNGEIKIENNPGIGVKFVLTLPVED